jgi:GntP family gluconate:H+ symporter
MVVDSTQLSTEPSVLVPALSDPFVVGQIETVLNPLVVFLVGVALLVVLLLKLKLPAFVGLVVTTMVVGLVSPEVAFSDVASQTAEGFGGVMTAIGIPILMAAIIGKTLMDSGAAERIVRGFMSLTGQNRSEYALLGSGYVLSVPVFFDNVFYLLAPIARSMRARVGGNYALFIVALTAGAGATHMFVPPTPGPLAAADELEVELGIAILVGIPMALVTSIVSGIIYGRWINNRMEIPLRDVMGTTAEELQTAAETETGDLPGLFESLLPILLAVVLVASNTMLSTFAPGMEGAIGVTTFIGDPNFALTVAALTSAYTFWRFSDIDADQFSEDLVTAIKDGGNIIAITAGGGAFGSMLGNAGVGQYIADILAEVGIPLIVSAWLVAAMVRIAQGSGTVALLTAAGMMAPLAGDYGSHPVFLMMAIGSGAIILSWYNDSGFWIVSEMGGLTQIETFKTWSAMTTIMSITGLITAVIFSFVIPL